MNKFHFSTLPSALNISYLCLFSLFESSQSLFWASFGMIGIDSFELTGIKSYTRFWGLLMFGCYSIINIIILLNLLIAMMSNSYTVIEVVLNWMIKIHFQNTENLIFILLF